jgi:hypothetical protein
MTEKKFFISGENIRVVTIHKESCIASDMIMVEGLPVGYMYREEPLNDIDSGWRFFAGVEDQEYVDNIGNLCYYAINTVANYDLAILPYLVLPVGSELLRIEGTNIFKLMTE